MRIVGMLVVAMVYGETNPVLADDIEAFTESPYEAAAVLSSSPQAAVRDAFRTPHGVGYGRIGTQVNAFSDDFYHRIHVLPAKLALGNVASAQTRAIVLWNAHLDRGVTLDSALLLDGEGLTATGTAPLPLDFQPMEEQLYTLTIADEGPPAVAATLTFTFDGFAPITVAISGTRINAWPVPADWTQPVEEALTWLTDVQHALDGSPTRMPLRAAPRRSFEFGIVEDRRERRILENLVFDWSARIWALPIFTDITLLQSPLAASADRVAIDTTGLDFAVGSLAMLWASAERYDLIEVASIAPNEVVFARTFDRAWPAGTRIYPCRKARMVETPTLRRKNDRVVTGRVRFECDEPCDWPAAAPATMYRGYPVLETRPEESDDPSATFARVLVVTDGEVGLIEVDDFSGLVYSRQSFAWLLQGRAARTAHRSLLYWLEGRTRALWVPTWTDDIQMVEPVTSSGQVLVVAAAGIARSLRQQAGRRHARIELSDGSVFHREVRTSTDLGDGREQITIDAAFGRTVAPGDVQRFCWMALCVLESDRIEISHVNDVDGVAKSRTTFIAEPGEEP